MTKHPRLASLAAILALALAACGGGAAAPSAVPASSAAAPKPAASAASVSAKPAASASASAKPAASGSAAAAGSAAPKPTATFVPRVAADTSTGTLTNYPIPGTEGKVSDVDIIDVDQEGHVLYMADRLTGIDEFDISGPTAKFLRSVKTPSPPNGVIVAKNVNRVVAGLTDSSVVSIDMGTHQIVGTVNTGGKKRADELDYDPKDKKVYVANSDDGIITAIDMTTFKVSKKFDNMGQEIEQPRYDPADGMMYVVIRSPEQLAQFDPAKDELVKKFDLPKGSRPSGIWMNPKTNVGIISTDPRPIVWDFSAGKMVGSLDQAAKGDEIFYDAKTDLYFSPGSSAPWGPTMSILGGTPIKFITNVATTSRSHNAGFDNTNNVVYTTGPDGLVGFSLPANALGGASASGGAAPKPSAAAKPSA